MNQPTQTLQRLAGGVLLAVSGVLVHGAAVAQVPTLAAAPVLSKLENPWDMAFLPDGTMFFTEKCKGLSVRQPSGTVTKLLGMKGSQGYGMTAADLF